MMGVTLFVLVGAFLHQQGKSRRQANKPIGSAPSIEVALEVPTAPVGTFDGVADSSLEERVQLERSELEITKAVARQLVPGHFEQLRAAPMGASGLAALLEDPASRRGELITLRGEILDIRERPLNDSRTADWFGRLQTATGESAYFVAIHQAERPLNVGDWVRVDGLFFKLYAEEGPAGGEWIEAPLIVAPQLNRSFEDFGEVADFEAERPLILGLSDDSLESGATGQGMPDLFMWRILALMRDMPEEEIDWDSVATLDGPTMLEIRTNGEPFRARPFILPVSKMQGMKLLQTGENPAGLTHRTEAWVANQNWTHHEPLLHIIAPGKREHLGVGSLVTGKLIYLRNMAYTTSENTRRVVPVFAGYDLSEFIPTESPLVGYIVAAFLGLTALMAGLIVILVRRDKKKSDHLQKKLLERKRARREKTLAGQGT